MKLHSLEFAYATWRRAWVTVAAPDGMTNDQLKDLLRRELELDGGSPRAGQSLDDLYRVEWSAEEPRTDASVEANLVVSCDGNVRVRSEIEWYLC